MTIVELAIKNEISIALGKLGASHELLSVVGSWGDTMEDNEVLRDLEILNSGASVFSNVLSEAPGTQINPNDN